MSDEDTFEGTAAGDHVRRIISAGIALLVGGLLSMPATSGSAAAQICARTNNANVTIADGPTGNVASSVTMAGCAGKAIATSAVEVHIVHTRIGDLVVDLLAPDGSPYRLHNRTGGTADNINKTYTVNLASEVAANGAWKLRVRDFVAGQAGFIDSWTLNLLGGDFSITASRASGSVKAGSAVTTTVSTTLITGVAQTTTLTASGLPAGATAAFAPSQVTTGGSSALTISTTGATAPGVYPVTITGTNVGTPTAHTTTYTLTVTTGCAATNGTDVPIPDNTTVTSSVTISGCAGFAAAGSTAELHITHPRAGVLILDLRAPSGSVYQLDNPVGDGVDFHRTLTVDLAGEVANGVWTLIVHNAGAGTAGLFDTWTLKLVGGGTGTGCTARTNGTVRGISDNATVNSSVTISGCAGAESGSTVAVQLEHPYVGDLVMDLLAPDGTVYGLHNRSGGETPGFYQQTYTVNLAGEAVNGVWTMRVQDAESGDTGTFYAWTLNPVGGGAGPGACTGVNNVDVTIRDDTTIDSSVTIAGCAGNAVAASTVEVDIAHGWIGDLVVDLLAPDGSVYNLHNRIGDSTNDINQTYTADLAGEAAAGTWKLRVQDAMSGDTGFIDTWTLKLGS